MYMQELETIKVSKEEAKVKYLEALQATKKHNSQHLKDLRKIYYHISRSGKKVIDIFETFKKVGLSEVDDPKLGICRADAKICYVEKYRNGSIIFSSEEILNWKHNRKADVVSFPNNTFNFKLEKPNEGWSNPIRKEIKASVPVVPVDKMPPKKLSSYHILWDVDTWELLPPKDPILLKRLTKNLFLIIDKWNLTKLERAVIRGRL